MTTIEVLEPEQWAVVIYGDNFGRVYLDTPPGLAMAMTKALDRLNEIQQITQEAALSISLPDTPRNKAILERFRPDALKKPANPIRVQVQQNGESLPITAMTVMSYNRDFDVDFFADDWMDSLKNLQLRELDLGVYLWDQATIEVSWAGDRQQLVMPLLAHFGGWYDAPTPGVRLEDLRLAFNGYLLLKACLCAVGWELESEHLRVGNGAYQYHYLSGERWYSYRGKEDIRFVVVNIDPARSMAGTDENILFDVVSDPLGLYNTTRPYDWFFGITDPGPFDVNVEVRNLKVSLPPPPAGEAAYTFFVQAYKNDNGTLVYLDFVTIQGATDRTLIRSIDFDILDRNATGGDSYGFFFGYGDLNPGGARVPYELLSCEVNFRPDFPYYERDQDVFLADLFAPETSGMQLFTAIAQLCNGKAETDYGRKVVRLEAAYDYSNGTDIIPGFFQRSLPPVDMTQITVPDGTTWKRVDVERDRFLNFAFAESKDAYVLDQQKQDFFNFIFDRVVGKEDTTDFENELFEITLEVFADSDEVGLTGTFLPALWDNTDGRRSNKLGPRVLVYYGLIDMNVGEAVAQILFEGDKLDPIPYFAQVALQPVPVPMVPVTFNGFANDLFRLHYRQEVQNEDDGSEYEILLTGGDGTYRAINFRRTILIQGEDAPLEVQPLAVKDHEFGSRVPLLIVAKLKSC